MIATHTAVISHEKREQFANLIDKKVFALGKSIIKGDRIVIGALDDVAPYGVGTNELRFALIFDHAGMATENGDGLMFSFNGEQEWSIDGVEQVTEFQYEDAVGITFP